MTTVAAWLTAISAAYLTYPHALRRWGHGLKAEFATLAVGITVLMVFVGVWG